MSEPESPAAIPPNDLELIYADTGTGSSKVVKLPSNGYAVYKVEGLIFKLHQPARFGEQLVENEYNAAKHAKAHLPVAVPDLVLNRYRNRLYLRYPLISGKPFRDVTDHATAMTSVGRLLGQIHKISPSEITRVNTDGNFLGLVARLYNEIDDPSVRIVAQQGINEWIGFPREADVFLHNDYHADNMLFDSSDNVSALLDWTSGGLGNRHLDLRYFLGKSSRFPANLRERFRVAYEQEYGSPIDKARMESASKLCIARLFHIPSSRKVAIERARALLAIQNAPA